MTISKPIPSPTAYSAGFHPFASAALGALAAMSNGLLGIAFWSRSGTELGQQVDHAVGFLFNLGMPVFIVLWYGLTLRGIRLSAARLVVLCVLLAASILVGQAAMAVATGNALQYWREQGAELTTLLAVQTVALPVSVALLGSLTSWGILCLVAGISKKPIRRHADTMTDLCAGIMALSFGLVVWVEWIDARVLFTDWTDFFPSGLAGVVKVCVALLFGGAVALGLRVVLRSIPAFSWAIGAPLAAGLAGAALMWSGWMLAQVWGADVGLLSGVVGFALAIACGVVLCWVPLRLWGRWRT